ncbi:MAG: NADP-dependent phosphogluconate dehydrogenase [Pseudomonadota bacterium]|nr:NADP-dependent phosphogluconate dehydrogenase [Pseudomonadota bacterium]
MNNTGHTVLVIGAGTMGRNLAINLRNGGASPVMFDISASALMEAKEQTGIRGCEDIAKASATLTIPRIALVMVPAGRETDNAINSLLNVFSKGDVIIDGGNADYRETVRRNTQVNSSGINFLGCGISGGAQGALDGVSVMVGGDRCAYNLTRGLLEAIAAKAKKKPCCAWVGHGGAGHFVKIVHNAIEYASMQIIAEAYLILRQSVGLQPKVIAAHMSSWLSDASTSSFLLEITVEILGKTDKITDSPLIDLIVDHAMENGTARWAVEAAIELGYPTPSFSSALQARQISVADTERSHHRKLFQGSAASRATIDLMPSQVRCAVAGATLAAYTQGFGLINAASKANGWNTNLSDVAKIWGNGCIIRHALLDHIVDGFMGEREMKTLISIPVISSIFRESLLGWRRTTSMALLSEVPVPTMASGLTWFDALSTLRCGAELIQAQRDKFGHHGFKRIDQPGCWHIE